MGLVIIVFVGLALLAGAAQAHRSTDTAARRRRTRQRYFLEH